MTHEPTQSVQGSEPREAQGPGAAVPIWLIVLMFLLLYWGALYFDEHGGWFSAQVYRPYRTVEDLNVYVMTPGGNAQGKIVFDKICALCHGNEGEGKPGQAPPLAGSEWAQGSANRMIRIPLVGLNGPIQVKGQQYNLSMAAMGAALNDDDLAAVLTYIRTSFGNKADPIIPAQVAAVRDDVKRSHPLAYTADELKNLPEK